MSKAVSRQDWEQRAAALQIQGQAFVAGQYQPALSGETFDCVSPIDGRVLALTPHSGHYVPTQAEYDSLVAEWRRLTT